MAFWRTIGRYLSGAGNRQVGLQSGVPSSYSNTSATPVTVDTALGLSAVWACTRMISEAVGSLPIRIWDVDAKGVKTLNTTHPLNNLFNGKTNRWQTRQEFFETLTFQLVLLGNAYAMKQKNSKGELIGLVPMMSEQMEVSLQDDSSRLYKYTETTATKVYAEDSIWHSKLFGNGIIGLSPLAYARNSIGIGQAAEQSVTKIYKNGGKPSGILMIDKVLTEPQREAVRQNFKELAEGNNDRLFVLEAGMKFEQVSLSPQDIELLQSRRFQIEDIARFFGVPSVLINDTAAGTTWGSGIQQIVQGFYKLGLRPYLERYEASMKAWLLTPEERLRIDIEFDFNALLQPDMKERITSGKEAVQGGLVTPNEWRKGEGHEPLDGGDVLLVQQQMIPISKAGTMQSQPVQKDQAEMMAKIDALANRRDSQVFNITTPEQQAPLVVSPPIVNITMPEIRYSAPEVNITNEIEGYEQPDIHITNPEVKVNVAAPAVKVENNVQPAEVKVQLPKRKTRTTVKYNKNNDIESSESIEEDDK